MDVKEKTRIKVTPKVREKKKLIEQFMSNSQQVENETLKVSRDLFVEAAQMENVKFEFIKLHSFQLRKGGLQISNAKNAILEAEYGVAETGYLVFGTQDTDVYLTIALAQTLHVVLPASKILSSCMDIELVKDDAYTNLAGSIQCISGASRRAEQHHLAPKDRRTVVYVIEDL